VERGQVGGREDPRFLKLESVGGESRRHPGSYHLVDGAIDAGHGGRIATCCRYRELEPAARRHEPGDRCRDGNIETERATQQRAPREPHRHAVRETLELSRQTLDAGRKEPRPLVTGIGATARQPARGLGHRPGIRVDPEDERVGVRDDLGQDGTPVTGPEVDDDPAMSPGLIDDLPDVHLGDAPADDRMHRRSMREPG